MTYSEYARNEIYNNIHFENQLRELSRRETPRILKEVAPFEGKKIRNVTGQLTKAFKEAVTTESDFKPVPLKEGHHAQIQRFYLSADYGTLKINYCIVFNGGTYSTPQNPYPKDKQYCFYAEKTLYIGTVGEYGTLIKLDEVTPSDDINADDEYKQFLKVQEIRTEYEREKRKFQHTATSGLISKV